MIGLNLTLDARNLARLRTLENISRLTAAKALTFTAQKAIPAWQAANARVFHLRRAWVQRGVRIRPATPGNLEARIGSIDKFMGRHTIGYGLQKFGKLLIPVYDNIASVGTHTQLRRKLANADSSARKPFKIVTASGKTLLVRRKGKARAPLEILGVLQEGAHMTPHLDALAAVAPVVNAEFGPVYERLLLKWAETGRV